MSNDLQQPQTMPADRADTAPAQAPATPAAGPIGKRVSRTRTSTAWLGICAATLLSVVLTVFMLQNADSVRVNFLWMHGSLPLALALLIAAVGAAILTVAVGAARMIQLRRLTRR